MKARKEAKKLAVDQGKDWEADQRAMIRQHYEGVKDTPLDVIEKELQQQIFNFAGTDARQSEMASDRVQFGTSTQEETFREQVLFITTDTFSKMLEDTLESYDKRGDSWMG